MVIQLLGRLLTCFEKSDEISQHLAVDQNWTKTDFKAAVAFARTMEDGPNCLNIDLEELKIFLVQKRGFLLRLLENPNLLEHGRFTGLLWATFHLTEELAVRPSMENLPNADSNQLSMDIQRVYRSLAAEWVSYVEHLKSDYPFLFPLVTRINPFKEHPSTVVA